MRSFLLASLASLAVNNVHAHPSGFDHGARSLSKRMVDLTAFRGVLDTGKRTQPRSKILSVHGI
jgi:extracellular elastinolytic metalloproteinase